MSEKVHHAFSPSTLQAREACPKFSPAQGDNAASLAGTRQHEAPETGEDSEMLADHEAIAVAECLAYCDTLAKNYPDGTVLKEEYLPIDAEHTTAGYADYILVSKNGKRAEVVDFKYGKQPVEDAENNLQGIAYLLGVKHRFPDLEWATVHFVCPHQDLVDRHSFLLTPEKTNELYLRVKVVVSRAKLAAQNPDDFSAARPAVSACMFCSLVGRCPKVTEIALNIGKKFSPIQLPETISPNMVSDPNDTAIGLKVAQVVTAWAKGFRAQVTERATIDPDFMPSGYQLVPMQRREVVDARKIVELAKKLLPNDRHEAVEALLDLPITGVEELIKISALRGKKTAAVKAFGEELEKSGAVKFGNPFVILRQTSGKNDE